MTEKSQPVDTHPTWCDVRRCTADPSADTIAGFGEHLSTPVELDLTAVAIVPSARCGLGYLSQVAAPWPRETYLRIEVDDQRLGLPVGSARPAYEALAELLTLSGTAEDC